MKEKAYEHLTKFLKDNGFEYEIEEIKLGKVKQPNSKPAYHAEIKTAELTLDLNIVQSNDNILVVNKGISSYELTKEAFNTLVEETKERQEKYRKNLKNYKNGLGKKNPLKESEALEIRSARKNRM